MQSAKTVRNAEIENYKTYTIFAKNCGSKYIQNPYCVSQTLLMTHLQDFRNSARPTLLEVQQKIKKTLKS